MLIVSFLKHLHLLLDMPLSSSLSLLTVELCSRIPLLFVIATVVTIDVSTFVYSKKVGPRHATTFFVLP